NVVTSDQLALRAETIEIEDLAAWVRTHFSARASERQIELAVEVDKPGGSFESDRKLVEMILQNLLENALKFTPAGGQVTFSGKVEGDSAQLQVRDTGCGIRSEDQSRIFERFYQADQARSGDNRIRGTGLGLAIVKHASEQLGGQIKLVSRLNLGTTITITLPASVQRAGSSLLSGRRQ
ncbi:MAG: sensor histidine kinase, partial [Planctomycetota bacterium]